MAIRRRAHHSLSGDIAVGARPILGDEWLAELVREPLANDTRGNVDPASRWGSHDEPHRPRRIVLPRRDPRHHGERGSGCCKAQKLATRAIHHFDSTMIAINLPEDIEHQTDAAKVMLLFDQVISILISGMDGRHVESNIVEFKAAG